MKRAGMPARRTTLRAGRARTPAWTGEPTAIELACQEVDRRSRGLCEANVPGVCRPGPHRGEHHHHQVLRSQGGPDDASNLLHVCMIVHDWAHNVDRAEAERLGIIKRGGLRKTP